MSTLLHNYTVKEFFYDTSFDDYKMFFMAPGIKFRETDHYVVDHRMFYEGYRQFHRQENGQEIGRQLRYIPLEPQYTSIAHHVIYDVNIAERITSQGKDIIREMFDKLVDQNIIMKVEVVDGKKTYQVDLENLTINDAAF